MVFTKISTTYLGKGVWLTLKVLVENLRKNFCKKKEQ